MIFISFLCCIKFDCFNTSNNQFYLTHLRMLRPLKKFATSWSDACHGRPLALRIVSSSTRPRLQESIKSEFQYQQFIKWLPMFVELNLLLRQQNKHFTTIAGMLDQFSSWAPGKHRWMFRRQWKGMEIDKALMCLLNFLLGKKERSEPFPLWSTSLLFLLNFGK